MLVRTEVSCPFFKTFVGRLDPLTRIVALSLRLTPETVIFVLWEPATASDGETEVIIGTSFVAEAPAQPFIIVIVKRVESVK